MNNKLAFLLAMALLSGCTSSKLSLPNSIQYSGTDPEARTAIIKALSGRNWIVESEEPGKILARVNVRTHMAKTSINYSGGSIRFSYADSNNLNCKPSTKEGEPCKSIHKKYNTWLNNLSMDISNAISYSM